MAFSGIKRFYGRSLPLQLLLPFMSSYLFMINSCRDGVSFFTFERNDKALKHLYCKVKNFESDLTYFTLYPKIRFFNGDIAIDVYPKIDQPVTIHDNADVVVPQTLIPAELELTPNESEFGINDPLLTSEQQV